MFTGIIRHMGILHGLEGKRISIECPDLRGSLRRGDSVAVNGVCLTVSLLNSDGFEADLLDETLALTSFAMLPAGCRLNLEAPLGLGHSVGGHLLSGHVDGTGRIITKVWNDGGDCELSVGIPDALNLYMLSKGSIAIDGVSLTIHELQDSQITLKLIPETIAATNLGDLQTGDCVNLEVDMMVKAVVDTVEKILARQQARN
jgi:riboflavin synthase